MSNKVRTIRLYGVLGTRFGRVHRFAVASTAEATRALCSQVKGFEKFLMGAKDQGLTFAVFNGRRNLGADDLRVPLGDDEIRIAPILIGSKSGGLFTTLLGVALVATSLVNPAGFLGASAASTLLGLGASMALGGVVQMLSPQQSGLASNSGPENGTSYYFNGAVNSTAEGDPVPIVYGRMRVGSKRVSSAIFAEDQT